MSSVRAIAKKSGVSIATVSRVLNSDPGVSNELRQKVVAIANSARYVAAVGKRSTLNIALAYTGVTSLRSPFDMALMIGLHEAMAESNYSLLILDLRRAQRTGETYSQMFFRMGVRGAVLRTNTGSRGICKSIVDEKFPAVVVGGCADEPGVSCLYSDSRIASREAIEYLIELGHRRIAIGLNDVEDFDHTQRLEGYLDALKASGLEVDEKLIFRAPAGREGGMQVIRRLATMADRPAAIYITDPMTAVGAIKEAPQIGMRVPEDLSLIGFDDSDIRYTTSPTMTCVCQDAAKLGGEAYGALMGVLDQDTEQPAGKISRAVLEIYDSASPAPMSSL